MKKKFQFTYQNIEEQYQAALNAGYKFITCLEYAGSKGILPELTVVNRVDIDLSVKKADRLRVIFDRLGIKASFFVRLHAPEYNPFSFENYRILKAIRDSGHEIGYHSEVVDFAAILDEGEHTCLLRDIDILNRMLNIKIQGVASHGGMTGLNNLDFWKERSPKDFGLKYEAYEESKYFNLFKRSLYISDSEWTRWKSYKNGILVDGDSRNLKEHIKDKPPLIYLLIHSDTYFDNHIYE
ncbi:MAG: hypothetical protein ACOVQB_08800 [Polynucleobacter sp.]